MGSALICSLSKYKILVFSDQLGIYLEALWHGLETLRVLPTHAGLCWPLAELPVYLQ